MAVDACDGRFAELGHVDEQVGQLSPLEIPIQFRLLATKAVEIRPGAEDGAGAGNDDHAHGGIAFCLAQRLAQFGDHLVAEGVASVRAVYGQGREGVTPGVEEMRRLHSAKYMVRDLGPYQRS